MSGGPIQRIGSEIHPAGTGHPAMPGHVTCLPGDDPTGTRNRSRPSIQHCRADPTGPSSGPRQAIQQTWDAPPQPSGCPAQVSSRAGTARHNHFKIADPRNSHPPNGRGHGLGYPRQWQRLVV